VTITLRAAAAAVLAVGLAVPAGSADARANNWTKVVNLHGAKVQACKVPTTQHGPWKIKVRVNATKATTAVRGKAEVDKGDRVVAGPWTPHKLQPGQMSKVHTMRMPRGKAFTFQGELDTDTVGVGSAGPASGISRC
jgi:opacity protein-like surface antigen